MSTRTVTDVAPEARSGLDPWRRGELPPAPQPKGLGWFSAIGPGIIVLGVSIGSGDVRVVYYSVLAIISVWGIIALRLTQPIILLALSANMAGIVFIISSINLLYVNTRLLPVALRPPLWRRLALVALALFYGLFLTMWVCSLIAKQL